MKKSQQTPAQPRASVHDYVAERALLADVLIYRKNFTIVAPKLTSDDFHLPAHRLIYQAVHNVMHSDKHIDATVVMHEIYRLDPDGLTDAIRIVGDIIAHGQAVTHADAHADIVRNLSLLRQLEAHAQSLLERCQDPQENPQALVQESVSQEYQLIQDYEKKGIQGVKPITDKIVDILRDEQQGKFKPHGLLVGFKHFDFCTGGLEPGDLVVIAAMTGAGKSAFAMNIVQHAAHTGKRMLVFSMEMTDYNLTDRMVFSESRISRDRRKQRILSSQEYDQAISGAHAVGQLPIYIDDTAPLALPELLVKIRQAKMQYQIDCVIVDYIQLVTSADKSGNRDERMGEISRTLKLYAKNAEIPIIALAQINRKYTEREGFEGKKPAIGDIRESGSIENDADIITFLYRPEIFKIREINDVSTRHRAIGIMGKVRNGSEGEFDLRFNQEYTLFEDLQPGERSICTNPIQMNEDYGEIPFGSDKGDIDENNFKELDPDLF